MWWQGVGGGREKILPPAIHSEGTIRNELLENKGPQSGVPERGNVNREKWESGVRIAGGGGGLVDATR